MIRYQLDERLVRLPVRINGVQLCFDLDSGARHTVIDEAAARRLGLTLVRGDRMGGAGAGTVAMQHARPIVVAIGSVRLRIADPWVLDLSHVGTTRHVDGLVGADFFNAYVIRIDPVMQSLALYDPADFRYDESGASIPLTDRDGRLFIPMTLTLGNNISARRSVRIDTGSGDAVSDNLVRQSPIRRSSLQGVGLGKAYVDYSSVFSSVGIGPYHIADVWGPSNAVPAVGMEILRRFRLTFDVRRHRLYLDPTRHLGDAVPSPPP